jgi:hypothetical protein
MEPSARLLCGLFAGHRRGPAVSAAFPTVCQDPFPEVPVGKEAAVVEPEGGHDDRLENHPLGRDLDHQWPGGQGRLNGHERHAHLCR